MPKVELRRAWLGAHLPYVGLEHHRTALMGTTLYCLVTEARNWHSIIQGPNSQTILRKS